MRWRLKFRRSTQHPQVRHAVHEGSCCALTSDAHVTHRTDASTHAPREPWLAVLHQFSRVVVLCLWSPPRSVSESEEQPKIGWCFLDYVAASEWLARWHERDRSTMKGSPAVCMFGPVIPRHVAVARLISFLLFPHFIQWFSFFALCELSYNFVSLSFLFQFSYFFSIHSWTIKWLLRELINHRPWAVCYKSSKDKLLEHGNH